jgi:Tfp pilus assembly protein PilF
VDFLIEPHPHETDRIWLEPAALAARLRTLQLESCCTTIACSVHGGYTGLPYKRLAAELYHQISGQQRPSDEDLELTYLDHELPDRFPPAAVRRRLSYRAHRAGACAMVRNEFARASELLAEAARMDPEIPGYHYIHALALRRMGDLSGAERAYRRALQLQDRMFMIYNDIGTLLASMPGRLDEAAEMLEQAHMLNPTSANVACSLGCVCVACNRPDRARTLLEQALQANPLLAQAAAQLAMLEDDPDRKHDYLARAAHFTPEPLTQRMIERELRRLKLKEVQR